MGPSNEKLKRLGRGARAWALDRFPFWGFFCLVVAAPFAILRSNHDYANLPQSAFIQVGMLAVLVLWLVRSAVRRKWRVPVTPMSLPLLAILGWSLLSFLWAHNRYEAFVVWAHWAACGLAFLLATVVVPSERDAWRLVAGVFVSGLVVSLLGVLQHLFEIDWVPQSIAPAATFANKNCAAQYVIVALPLGAAVFLTSRRRVWDWLVGLGLALMCVFLFHAFSKAGLLALGVQVVALAALLLRDRLRLGIRPPSFAKATEGSAGRSLGEGRPGPANVRSKLVAGSAGLVVFLILVNLTHEGFRWAPGKALERVSATLQAPESPGDHEDSRLSTDAAQEAVTGSVDYEISVGLRFALWRNTLVMVKDHLLAGVGVGNWPVQYPRYSSKAVLDRFVTSKVQSWRAHNDHLQNLAELGLVGLALYAWLGYGVFLTCSRPLTRSAEGRARYAAMSVAAAVLGMLVVASFSFPLRRAVPPLCVMVYLGLVGGALARGEPGNGSPKGGEPRRPARLPAAAAVPTAALVFILLILHAHTQCRWLAADRHYQKMLSAKSAGDWSKVISEGYEVHRRSPGCKLALTYVAKAHILSGDPGGAVGALKEVLQAYPYHLNAHTALGVAYAKMREPELALASYRRAIEIRPEHAAAHNNLGYLLLRRGELDEAVESLDRALRYDPQNSMYLKNAGLAHAVKGNLDEALKYYRRALGIRPDYAVVHNNIGDIYTAKKQLAEALEHYRLAARYDPAKALFHHNLGFAAFRLGRHGEAKAAFEKTLELRPDWALAHKNLGAVLYDHLGEKDEGLRHLARALELAPDIPEADKIRRAVERRGRKLDAE